MKSLLLTLVLACCSFALFAQQTMTLRCTKDSKSFSVSKDVNNIFGNSVVFNLSSWTFSGEQAQCRAYLDFNWDSLPPGAEILEAKLFLFRSIETPEHKNSGDNRFAVQRITSDWSEKTLTWNNKPSFTASNEVLVNEASTGEYQDYEIDVTPLAKIIFQNQTASFGFQLKLTQESPYRALYFASKETADANYHPKLLITYKAPIVSDLITLAIDPNSYCAGDTVFVPFQTKVAFTTRNTFTAMISDATGSFDLPQVIGSLDQGSTVDEKITMIAILPNDLVAGSQYRIRVTASLPQMVGSSSETKLTIKPSPAVPTITRNGKLLVSSASSGNQWFDEKGAIPGAVDRSFLPASAGNYYVVTTQGGCSARSNAFSYTGRNENAWMSSSLMCYPNPANEAVTINYSVPFGECATLEVFTNTGAKILEQKLTGLQGQKELNTRLWAEGVYLFRFNCNGQIHTQKLVISR